MKYKFGVLGVGKMGGAFLNGVISSNIFPNDEIIIYTLEEDIKEKYKSIGVEVANNEREVFENSSITLIAIKPQMYDEVLSKVKDFNYSSHAILSLAPGKSLSYLKTIFNNAAILRLMPNTPASVNMATITVATNDELGALKIDVENILSSIGIFEYVKESHIDEALPLNGSQPAYIFAFIKEFIECGKEYGIDEESAKKLLLNTIKGSIKLIENSSESLDTLVNNVCSKGGTTIAGLDAMYKNGFKDAIKSCYNACVNRSKELAKK
jgi:pyrroline-5-carboxylate reductase